MVVPLIVIALILGPFWLLTYFRGEDYYTLKCMPLNELGDFFAGIAGSLALMLLMISVLIQRHELTQNTKVLEQQKEELAGTKELYAKMVAINQEHLKALRTQQELDRKNSRLAQKPQFILREVTINDFNAEKRQCRAVTKNIGPFATDLKFTIEPECEFTNNSDWKKMTLETNECHTFRWNAPIKNFPNQIFITIECLDSAYYEYKVRFTLHTTDQQSYRTVNKEDWMT